MRLLATAATVVLIVLAAGCGGSDEPDPSPTRAADSADAADVCGLVPGDLLERVSLYGPMTTKLAYGNENVVVCGRPGTVTVEFGYALTDGAPFPEVVEGGQVSEVEGVGDEAVRDGDEFAAAWWAEQDGVTSFVRNDSLGSSAADDRVDDDTSLELLKALVEAAPKDVVERTEPIALGPLCPPADSAEVTALTGDVVTARGGEDDTDGVECQYLGAGGTRVDVSLLVQDDVEADFRPDDAKDVDMDGAESAWETSLGDPGQVALSWTTAPDTLWSLDATPLTWGSDYDGETGPATLGGAQELGRAVMALNAAGG